MRRTVFGCLLVLLAGMGVMADVMARPDADPPSPSPAVEFKNSVTLDLGAYHLKRSSQDWSIGGPYVAGGCFLFILCSGPHYTWSGLANQFNTSSRDVFGIGYERQFKHGFGVGISYFQMTNSFVIPSVTPSQGAVTTKLYFLTGRKYFASPGGFQPFIGLGIGQFSAGVGGPVNKSVSGSTGKAELGLGYQSGRFRAVIGYRVISAYEMFALGVSPHYTGDVFGDLDLSGRGGFADVGVAF